MLCYLGNRIPGAALGVAITDTHPAHRDIFDRVIILETREMKMCHIKFFLLSVSGPQQIRCASYPSGDDGIYVFRVSVAEGHEVSVERAYSLQTQTDVSRRRELQQFWGQIICAGTAVYKRCVDLCGDVRCKYCFRIPHYHKPYCLLIDT